MGFSQKQKGLGLFSEALLIFPDRVFSPETTSQD
jgi:hypothetical protein